MVAVSIKMRDGSTYQTQLNVSLEDSEKHVFSGSPFVRLAYENGYVYLAVSDISAVVGAEVPKEQSPPNEVFSAD